MATFTFNGAQAMVFPTIAVTVQPGDSFDAPDDFIAEDVTLSGKAKKADPAPAPAPETAPATIEEAPATVEEGTN